MTAAYSPDFLADDDLDFPSANSAVVARYSSPVMDLASPNEIHSAMMQLDEQALLAEIMGEALEKWFYSFKVSGKLVEGVSSKGAHEFARLRAEQGFPIRFPAHGIRYEEAIENGEGGVRVFVVARDVRTHQEGIGMAFYPYNATRADGRKEFDKFAGRKAMSVAERNAILRLVPEQTIVAALKVRAQIVARNEAAIAERARIAVAARPEAPRVTAGAPAAPADPYAPTPTASSNASTLPPCPVCGGEMWDNRETRKNPRSPDFKCKNGPRARGGPGCTGVIWPDSNAGASAPVGELPLDANERTATTRRDALREG